MLINRKSLRDGRTPIIFSILLLVAANVSYRLCAAREIHGPSGGNLLGLVYGGAGTAMILFAMLLMARKTWHTLRVGSAYQWLQWHVWIALVSYPIIGYHAGWRWGGPLTTLLMVIFTIVWASGILGLLLQNLVPILMRDQLSKETVYEQIDKVDRENLKAARRLVHVRLKVMAGGEEDESDALSPLPGYSGGGSGWGPSEISDLKSQINEPPPQPSPGVPGEGAPADALLIFYEAEVRPYLAHGLRSPPASWWMPWRTSRRNLLNPTSPRPLIPPPASAFARMRSRFPGLFEELNALEDFVEQRRQHRLQKRLHWVMHGWLLLHVPLSFAMVILIPLHAVLSLRY
jgi:hypothetical protein